MYSCTVYYNLPLATFFCGVSSGIFIIPAIQHRPVSEKNARIAQHYLNSFNTIFDMFPRAGLCSIHVVKANMTYVIRLTIGLCPILMPVICIPFCSLLRSLFGDYPIAYEHGMVHIDIIDEVKLSDFARYYC